ncbi:MAG: hypothetical protein CM1200mP41_29760 [Gammaproteobacteria bacterium]|nr:MAG: hypothetical protein CM1200mP41_29760 [Gammaproteobacteria bacterium]
MFIGNLMPCYIRNRALVEPERKDARSQIETLKPIFFPIKTIGFNIRFPFPKGGPFKNGKNQSSGYQMYRRLSVNFELKKRFVKLW